MEDNRPEGKNCSTCRFWVDERLCVYNPPQIYANADGEWMQAWPETTGDGWCGRHEGDDEYRNYILGSVLVFAGCFIVTLAVIRFFDLQRFF